MQQLLLITLFINVCLQEAQKNPFVFSLQEVFTRIEETPWLSLKLNISHSVTASSVLIPSLKNDRKVDHYKDRVTCKYIERYCNFRKHFLKKKFSIRYISCYANI